MLDGELVADAGKASDFYRLGPRLWSRRNLGPVSFVAFDLIVLDGELITDRPYRERRAGLESLDVNGSGWCTTSSFDGEARDVFDACASLGLEGLVAKHADSVYRPGKRSTDWVKVKTVDWRTNHAPLRHERQPRRPDRQIWVVGTRGIVYGTGWKGAGGLVPNA